MNIIKYFISKSYRNKTDEEYTKKLCAKIKFEEEQLESIYSFSLSNRRTTETSA
jgi:hypothetical protein